MTVKIFLAATCLFAFGFTGAHAADQIQRGSFEITACEYNADKQINLLKGRGKKGEITFEMQNQAVDLCKRFKTGRQYIIAYTDLDEAVADGPTAILKRIQPR